VLGKQLPEKPEGTDTVSNKKTGALWPPKRRPVHLLLVNIEGKGEIVGVLQTLDAGGGGRLGLGMAERAFPYSKKKE